jgi:hypothetical protein
MLITCDSRDCVKPRRRSDRERDGCSEWTGWPYEVWPRQLLGRLLKSLAAHPLRTCRLPAASRRIHTPPPCHARLCAHARMHVSIHARNSIHKPPCRSQALDAWVRRRLQVRANAKTVQTFNASLSTTWVGVDDSAAKQSSWQLWQCHTCQSKSFLDSLTSLATRCQVTQCSSNDARRSGRCWEGTFTTPCPTRQRVALSSSSVCIACMLPANGSTSRSTIWTERFRHLQENRPISRAENVRKPKW